MPLSDPFLTTYLQVYRGTRTVLTGDCELTLGGLKYYVEVVTGTARMKLWGQTRKRLICMVPTAPEDLDPCNGEQRLIQQIIKRQNETLPHIDYDVHQIH